MKKYEVGKVYHVDTKFHKGDFEVTKITGSVVHYKSLSKGLKGLLSFYIGSTFCNGTTLKP